MTHLALWLSQTQFFISLSFMLLFLLLELGLAWALAFFKLRALAGNQQWTPAYRFWVRVFALSFILAFASAVPVMIQFGSLWPALLDRIGDVASPLLAGSVLSIFLFKSCLVGAMLFGQRSMPDRLHGGLVVAVAVGVTLAAMLPIVLFRGCGRRPAPCSQWAISREPRGRASSSTRPSMVRDAVPRAGCGLTALFMCGVAAMQSVRRPLLEADKAVFRIAVRASVIALLVLGISAVISGRVLAEHEPARAAAAMGYWHTGPEPSIALFGQGSTHALADQESWRWSGVGGMFLARDPATGNYRGLDQYSGMSPPQGVTFWSLRIAILAGLMMLSLSAIAAWRFRVSKEDPADLPLWLRKSLSWVIAGAWTMAVAGFAQVSWGAHPYAVSGTVTISEVMTNVPVYQLMLGGIGLIVVYGFCMVGFFQLVWHGAHYGVVPVARHRGRA